MKVRNCLLSSLLVALISASPGKASAATSLLSDLISSGGQLTAGDLSFSSFLAAPQNTVDPATVEVSTFVDALGRIGIQFASPLSITTGGGSNEIVADFLFTTTESGSASALHDITQSFSASVSGSSISAFDFTRGGALSGALPTLAANCVNGDVAGCPQIISPTDSSVVGDVTSLRVEREVQLVRGRGGTGTGDLTSWSLAFGQAAVATAVPEPSTWMLMIGGFAAAGAALRRKRDRRSNAAPASESAV